MAAGSEKAIEMFTALQTQTPRDKVIKCWVVELAEDLRSSE